MFFYLGHSLNLGDVESESTTETGLNCSAELAVCFLICEMGLIKLLFFSDVLGL